MARFRVLMVLLAASVVGLTGCVRLHIDYDIQGRDRIDMIVDVAVRNSEGEFPEGLCTDDLLDEELVNERDSVTEYAESGPDGYSGCRMIISGTMYEMSGEGVTLWAEGGEWEFHQEPRFFEDTGYTEQDFLDWVADYRISVTFPEQVYTNNGSSTVSGSTVTWSDLTDAFNPEGLRATGNDTLGEVVSLLVGLVTIVVAVAIVVVAFAVVRRNKAKIAAADAQQSGNWPQPPTGAGGYPQPPRPGSGPNYPGYGQPAAPRPTPRGWPYQPDAGPSSPSRPPHSQHPAQAPQHWQPPQAGQPHQPGQPPTQPGQPPTQPGAEWSPGRD